MIDQLRQYQRMLSIAEAGLFYGKDVYDIERFQEVKDIALTLLSEAVDQETSVLKLYLDKQDGYPTPKVDVRALIRQEDKVLLVQDRATKEWSLPGGYAEVGLTPKENIQKEVLEETGLHVAVGPLRAIFDTNLREDIPQLFQYYKLVFACEVISGAFAANSETVQSHYFELEDLPTLSMKRTTKEQLVQLVQDNQLYVE
ncbi:NUDIX hydrolase N-terminal domain-containing protein [Enterococcus sp. RIT-PI-f]|uniref:NUDIX hydrolase N-terminal domain-containing protein n=1 Tax=Enterococcus sp. RIT-PI-f TaxID=1690244 RepID=UPI0006B9DD56|nr:NUDIX hydrolase [Enterococcus sp. RIT-PI-f]KPG70089.1 DNA mismatch repair protein MutT [Enterococcus sp. RIT-PI-f]